MDHFAILLCSERYERVRGAGFGKMMYSKMISNSRAATLQGQILHRENEENEGLRRVVFPISVNNIWFFYL